MFQHWGSTFSHRDREVVCGRGAFPCTSPVISAAQRFRLTVGCVQPRRPGAGGTRLEWSRCCCARIATDCARTSARASGSRGGRCCSRQAYRDSSRSAWLRRHTPSRQRTRGWHGRHPSRAIFPVRVFPSSRVAAVVLVSGSGCARNGPGGTRVRGAAAPRGTAPPAPGDAHRGCLDRVADAHAPRRVVGPGGRLDPPGGTRVLPIATGSPGRRAGHGAPCARPVSRPGSARPQDQRRCIACVLLARIARRGQEHAVRVPPTGWWKPRMMPIQPSHRRETVGTCVAC